MGRHARLDATTVVAARDGDRRSLEDLVAEHLPLVYNIVGRALNGHPDVDDVVQETMLLVVRKVHSLRDSTRFRAWLVAIAMQQVRARARARQETYARQLDEAADVPDPSADFVDLTITQLGLAGQRKEVAEATRWLDPDDRRLLSLWWLEAAGEISRDELAAALNVTTPHAAVRVQRMKSQLHAARAVVRALWSDRHCAGLLDLLQGWDAKPSTLWRKRLVRHTKGCAECGRHWSDLVPAERLLAGVALLPVSAELAVRLSGDGGASLVASAVTGPGAGALPDGLLDQVREQVATKPGLRLGMYASAVVLAVGGVYIIAPSRPIDPGPAPAIAAPLPSAEVADPTPMQTGGSLARGSRAERAPAPEPEQSRPAPPGYGSNVDQPDAPPPPDRKPGDLPKRPEGGGIKPVDGRYLRPYQFECAVLRDRGHSVRLTGTGYFKVWWTIDYDGGGGELVLPTWTGLKGKLFHAASGGGHRMDDRMPGTQYPDHTWMGKPGARATLPRGTQQMWQSEYYYLDGEVTLHQTEGYPSYDLMVVPKSWSEVAADLNQSPDNRAGVVRYGHVRDSGTDGAPVPQYVTRQTPPDPRTVPQRSQV